MKDIRICQNKETGYTQVLVGGVELQNVRSVNFNQSVDTLPCFGLEMSGYPDIEMDCASVQFSFSPQTIEDAAKVLRHSLLSDEKLHNAFVASILSAIKDVSKKPSGITDSELAVLIADRITGRK